jgi:hypothetical protein
MIPAELEGSFQRWLAEPLFHLEEKRHEKSLLVNTRGGG